MSDLYRDVVATAQMLLNQSLEGAPRALTTEEIESAVTRAMSFYDCRHLPKVRIVAELEASYQTIIGAERTLYGEEEGYEPWLSKRKAEIDWRFWTRYRQYLLQRNNWSQPTIDSLEESTDRILGLLTDPERPERWDRRGLVVGHVQSGKTANYIGLICKAADAGYKLIVVLTGFHKSLRSQTQIRLEEGFLGYDRAATINASGAAVARVGVGTIDPIPIADSITTRADDGDFKSQVARTFGINPGGHPLLFVVKKNGPVLKNLLNWVEFAATSKDETGRPFVSGVPLLVIDDEADQGSIDTRDGAFNEVGDPDPDHDPTVLNSRIRTLLHLFDQSAYVGYTATPFANILIHEGAKTGAEGEDLFPRSFIVSLPSPSTHVGPSLIFGFEDDHGEQVPGLPIIRLVEDHAASLKLSEREGWMPPKHKISHNPRFEGADTVPESLKEAIWSFVLVCAARAARGDGDAHNSMLVHVTRFTRVQHQVAEQVRAEVRDLGSRIKYGDGASTDNALRKLRQLWESEFEAKSDTIAAAVGWPVGIERQSWEAIRPHLDQAILSIKVREINGAAGEVLDYVDHQHQGLNVIAIGGDKLSRGLTLEGLSISYFLRASRMYDTLMQMGRWFGYRPRYLDLCRLYTTPEMTDWFSHIASATEELRGDFDRMAASGSTPRDFGQRVRSHPLMMVTSQVKMRHGTTIDLSYEGAISETIDFWRRRPRLEINWDAASRLLQEIEARDKVPTPARDSTDKPYYGPWKWTGAKPDSVLAFLANYAEHSAAKRVKTKLLADYVRQEVSKGRLQNWTVVVASGESDRIRQLGSVEVRLVRRSWHLSGGDDESRRVEKQDLMAADHYRIRRLLNPADEWIDLSPPAYKRALEATIIAWKEEPRGRKKPDRPNGPAIRAERDPNEGLLLIYPLDGADGEDPADNDKVESDAHEIPVIGCAISFPTVHSAEASKVKYVVGNVYYQQELGLDYLDGDDS
jgi:hypothetical protein